MSDIDVIEQRIEQAFANAHSDPRWAATPWTDPVVRIRRARRRHAVKASLGAGFAVIATTAAALGVVSAVGPSSDRVRVVPPAAGGSGSGLDWLLTPQQYAAFAAAHPSPSAAPDSVASPAPLDDEARQLQADVIAAVPDAHALRVDAADGGESGRAVVWVSTVDGTPLAVERYRLGYPISAGTEPTPAPTGGSEATAVESFTTPTTWADATAYTVATGDQLGYAFGVDQQWNGPVVWTVTADGWFTSWTAPVAPSQLLRWARTGDEHFTSSA